MVTTRSLCLFCSLGCGVAFRGRGGQITEIDYDSGNPINNGSLCPRGHYNIEILNSPQRLITTKIPRSEPDTIVISGMASNEEAYLAAKLANKLGIKNISCAADKSDLEAYSGQKLEVPGAVLGRVVDIDCSESLLIIGDILTRSPVLSQRVNKVKYGKRGNKIIVVDPNRSHTSWFATNHLKIKPGTEAPLLAGFISVIKGDKSSDLEKISAITGIPSSVIINSANEFNASPSGYVIFAPSANMQRNDLISFFVKILSGISQNKKCITFYSYGNTLGVNLILDRMVPDRAVDDQSGSNRLELIDPASHFTEGGSFMFADGRVEDRPAICPKFGPKSISDIICMLLGLSPEEEKEKAIKEVKDILSMGVPARKAEIQEKISEALNISGLTEYPIANITHFGDNQLVSNFFWYRVNN